jgi:curved DNA-binding protein
MATPRDFYAVLGVPRTAGDKDIRQAYRRLARKHHPDLNPNDKSADARFKELQHAYEVLSDPAKRAKYDRFGPDFERLEGAAGGAQSQARSGRGGRPDVNFGSVFGGDLFGSLFNAEARPGSGFGARGFRMPGEDIEHAVEVTLEEAYRGTTRTIQLEGADGSLRTLEVKIPAGVSTGSRVRVAGQGGPGFGGAANGDLHLVVSVRPHPTFERRGDDLYVGVPVSLSAAMLGGEVQVPTPKGTRLALKVPPESQNGQRFRLADQGMPRLGSSGQGDLYAELKVQLPRGLSSRERELFQELASLRSE